MPLKTPIHTEKTPTGGQRCCRNMHTRAKLRFYIKECSISLVRVYGSKYRVFRGETWLHGGLRSLSGRQ